MAENVKEDGRTHVAFTTNPHIGFNGVEWCECDELVRTCGLSTEGIAAAKAHAFDQILDRLEHMVYCTPETEDMPPGSWDLLELTTTERDIAYEKMRVYEISQRIKNRKQGDMK